MPIPQRLSQQLRARISSRPIRWLVTGAAGFIGSNLTEALLSEGQRVVGLDNFATGTRDNLDDVRRVVGRAAWTRLTFIEGDIRDVDVCRRACAGIDIVLHQAALGSVPRSFDDPIATNQTNIDGFLNMLVAARDQKVGRFVYAASSSTYGDSAALPKVEDNIGKPLSPYAVTKLVNELYAGVFASGYGLDSIGLRYFNVFGARQLPHGPYAAVIPRWVGALLAGEPCQINGDGETTRDFCHVSNAVQANLLAALSGEQDRNMIYNVAVGQRTSLNQLFDGLVAQLASEGVGYAKRPVYREFRVGDVRHSLADIGRAAKRLGYAPTHTLTEGLAEAMPWYLAFIAQRAG